MRTKFCIFGVLFLAFGAGSQAQVADKPLMSDAEYRTYLTQIETAAPKWETTIENLAPDRVRRTSYATGKSQIDIGQICAAIAEQRLERTVSGELALLGSLQSLREMGKVMAWEQVMNEAPASLEKFDQELNALIAHLKGDVNAKVALLDKGIEPPARVEPATPLSRALSNERLKRIERKDFPISGDNEYRVVDGMWVTESTDPAKALVFPEQVKITCINSEKICRELTVTLGAYPGVVSIADIDEKVWTISSWDAHGLLASYGPEAHTLAASDRCQSHVLTLAFASGAASTSDIPNREKGCETFTGTNSYRLVRGEYYVDTSPANDIFKPNQGK